MNLHKAITYPDPSVNIRFVLPRAKVSSGNGYVWYESNKSSNCANLDDACAYVASSINENANSLA